MRFIHPATWLGLLINALYLSAVLGSSSFISPEVFSEIVGPEMNVDEVLKQVRTIVISFMCFQLLSVVVLMFHPRFGFLLAALSGFVMLPLSFVFLLGAFLSYYSMIYSDFATAPPADLVAERGYVYPNGRVPNMFKAGVAIFALGFVMVALGIVTFGIIFVFAAPIILFVATRSKKLNPLQIYPNYIAVQPNVLCRELVIPYEDIRSATIMAGEVLQLNVSSKDGVIPIACPLQNLYLEDRKDAVKLLAELLTDHGVELH